MNNTVVFYIKANLKSVGPPSMNRCLPVPRWTRCHHPRTKQRQ